MSDQDRNPEQDEDLSEEQLDDVAGGVTPLPPVPNPTKPKPPPDPNPGPMPPHYTPPANV